MSWTMAAFFGNALDRHFGGAISFIGGVTFQPVLHGFLVLLIFWLLLYWMYRRKIFLRI
jgi:heparan-alpha-glucosaminide N-acetyltransferase